MKKNKIIILLIINFISFNIFTQNAFKLNSKGEVIEKTKLESLIKERGYDIVSAFDTISKNPIIVCAIYSKNKKFGLINNYGKEITSAKYDEFTGLIPSTTYTLFGYHENIIVKIGDKHGLIDKNGKEIIPVIYDYLTYDICSNEYNSSVCKKDSLYSGEIGDKSFLFNTKGKIIKNESTSDNDEIQQNRHYKPDPIDTLIAQAKSIGNIISKRKNGFFVIEKKIENRYYEGIYDLKNKTEIIPFEYDYIIFDRHKNYVAIKNKKSILLDSLGKVISLKEYEYIDEINGIYRVTNDGKIALFSKDFIQQTGFIYDVKTEELDGNFMVLRKNGKCGIINYDFKEITEFIYDDIIAHRSCTNFEKNTLIVATLNNKKGIINLKGEKLTNFEYEEIIPECVISSDSYGLFAEPMMDANRDNRFLFYKKDGKYGILDTNYAVLFENKFDGLNKSIHDNFVYAYQITKDNKMKWGVLNIQTKSIVIPLESDIRVEYQNDGYFIVKKNNQFILNDSHGKIAYQLIEESEFSINQIYNGLIRVYFYNIPKRYYIDYRGKKIEYQRL
jgi:hypothetical protein